VTRASSRPTPLQLVLFVPALISFIVLLSPGVWKLEDTDFAAFYMTAKALRLGVDATTLVMPRPSLSPPTLSLLLRPLTYVSLPLAFGLWTALGAALMVAALRSIHRVASFTPRAVAWIVLANLAAVPFFQIWSMGQLGWVLLYLVTRAWLARSATAAGAWLGLAVAIKPPLALMALALAWPVCVATGLSGAAFSLAALALTGIQPWLQWWELQRVVSWIGLPWNLSFFAIGARAAWPADVTLHDLPAWGFVVAALLGVATFVVTCRTSGPRRWAMALLWSVFVSPIGWTHYLPLALGPLWLCWRRTGVLMAGVVLLAVPNAVMAGLVNGGGPGAIAGLYIYPVGAWLLWTALAARADLS
jgi:hypothetical protein